MRRCLLTLGAVAVAAQYGSEGEYTGSTSSTKKSKSSSSSKNAILTSAGAVGFIADSVFLTKDLSCFLASFAFELLWENVPPKVQAEVTDKYDEIMDQITTVRMQNGVPSYDQLKKDITGFYNQKIKPQVSNLYTISDMLATPVMTFVTPIISKFETAYPSQKGKLPAHVLDLTLVLFFLMYYVVSYLWSMLCCVLCCGCCKSRAKKQPELKKKPQPVPAGKKKN